MPSSSRPYQSKLLKFVLQQWQQGWERQDQAFRQLQSTATLGAQVAILPIYVIMGALKRANLALESGNTPSTQKTNAPTTKATETVTDLDHSLTTILTRTQQLLSDQQVAAIEPRQTSSLPHGLLGKVQHWLSRLGRLQQHHRKRHPGNSSDNLVPRHPQTRQVTSLSRPASGSSERLAKRYHSQLSSKATSGLQQQGTTLASSIKTRRLVLVNLKNEVFDIFTPDQQKELKHYIDRVMYAYRQTRTIARRQTKQFSVNTVFTLGAAFLVALPGEFQKALSQLTAEPSLPPISSNAAQPQPRVFHPQTSRHVRAHRLSTPDHSKRRLSSKSPHAFEANVKDVSYVEHPLERFLRLIDRVLTWCEHRWQQWLKHRANIG